MIYFVPPEKNKIYILAPEEQAMNMKHMCTIVPKSKFTGKFPRKKEYVSIIFSGKRIRGGSPVPRINKSEISDGKSQNKSCLRVSSIKSEEKRLVSVSTFFFLTSLFVCYISNHPDSAVTLITLNLTTVVFYCTFPFF
jgi:hypothetical protein